jgi:hypothetical protein
LCRVLDQATGSNRTQHRPGLGAREAAYPLAQPVKDTAQRMPVHAADAFFVSRLEPVPLQQVERTSAARLAQQRAELFGFAVQHRLHRRTGCCGVLHGLCQEPSGELVVPVGQVDRNLFRRTPVELRGPARPRTGLPAAPLVDHVEQGLVGQAVEVERMAATLKKLNAGTSPTAWQTCRTTRVSRPVSR